MSLTSDKKTLCFHEIRFATDSDFQICKNILKTYGTTYFFASRWLKPALRKKIEAIYGFVRAADNWVDDVNTITIKEKEAKLKDAKKQIYDALEGISPKDPVLRAFVDVMIESQIPIEESLLFLESMEMDLTQTRYRNFEELNQYMRGSASAVGIMMCHAVDVGRYKSVIHSAILMGKAMQLTNFLRDIGVDAKLGRIYIPQEDLERFGVSEKDILASQLTPQFKMMMRYQIERAKKMYAEADLCIPTLPKHLKIAITLASRLYSKILDKIQQNECDVFNFRARTTKLEKILLALQILLFKSLFKKP